MAEILGGSRGRKDAQGTMSSTMLRQRLGQNMGATQPAYRAEPQYDGGQRAASAGRARPTSAPIARPGGAQDSSFDVRWRVEEKRRLKEAGLWGQPQPSKRDLPAFWSIAKHGQPYNDVRLTMGVNTYYKVLEPTGLKVTEVPAAGPASESLAAVRRSLVTGTRMYDSKTMLPLPKSVPKKALTVEEREALLIKMSPHQRLHALRLCLDRDTYAKDFTPWTQFLAEHLNAKEWHEDRDQTIRIALSILEKMMHQHIRFMSEQDCRHARAPSAEPKRVLLRAFWKVDPTQTGSVSLQQFMQVWQNVLQLFRYEQKPVFNSKGIAVRHTLLPKERFLLDRSMTAALFVKYGFDKDGLLPYVVFIEALCSTPARLLGHEIVLDKADTGKNGFTDDTDVAYAVGQAKIIYPKCRKGVFPPSDFDPRVAERSNKFPKAHLTLEHVFGYSGSDILSNNIYYTHNCSATNTEIAYYAGAVGIVFNREKWDSYSLCNNLEQSAARLQGDHEQGIHYGPQELCQRFFFGHDNDIMCMAMHPNRKFVATGQQLQEGGGIPFVCVWDIDTCEQLARLDHEHEDRAVIAAAFSGDRNAKDPAKIGGSLLCTVTSDDRHCIHIWRWCSPQCFDANGNYQHSMYIPGWFYGPDKKFQDLKTSGLFYPCQAAPDAYGELVGTRPETDPKLVEKIAKMSQSTMVSLIRDKRVNADDADGFLSSLKRHPWLPGSKEPPSIQLDSFPGCNGTPPMVYGVAFNPYRPHDGRKGTELLSYGVKHLKTFCVNDQGQWQGVSALFGKMVPQNVYSAIFVRALHDLAGPGDCAIVTGFASGELGIWVPPYPTKANSAYQLTRIVAGHDSGPKMVLNDGTQTCGGVRVIVAREGGRILTGGSDGVVMQWRLKPPEGARPDGTPKKGVVLEPLADKSETTGPNRFVLNGPSCNDVAMIVGLDCHPSKQVEFVAGTSGNDIWEVDKDPRVLVEGHELDLYHLAVNANCAYEFATVSECGKIRIFDIRRLDVVRSANVGFPLSVVDFSEEIMPPIPIPDKHETVPACAHIAIGGKNGRIVILAENTLKPIYSQKHATDEITELKYSPPGGPRMLAAGSADLKIYIYRLDERTGYELLGKCHGHSSSILHLDWSYPIALPLQYYGKFILQTTDQAMELLYWDPYKCRQITADQRDAGWYTMTCTQGFTVMGIWPDGSDRTDINALCRGKLGAPQYNMEEAEKLKDRPLAVKLRPSAIESADGVPGCGYVVTSDDFSFVNLFNYPVVADDAPYKRFRGHSSHVMCIRFSVDDRHVFSVGGHDRCVMQWRTTGMVLEDLEKDYLLLDGVEKAVEFKRNQATEGTPGPQSEWVDLSPDQSGRIMGPKPSMKGWPTSPT